MIHKENFQKLNPYELLAPDRIEILPFGADYYKLYWSAVYSEGILFMYLDEEQKKLGGIKCEFDSKKVNSDTITKLFGLLCPEFEIGINTKLKDLLQYFEQPVYSHTYETGYESFEFLYQEDGRFAIVCMISPEGKIAEIEIFSLDVLGRESMN